MGISGSNPKLLFSFSYAVGYVKMKLNISFPLTVRQKVTEENSKDTSYFLGKVRAHSNSRRCSE